MKKFLILLILILAVTAVLPVTLSFLSGQIDIEAVPINARISSKDEIEPSLSEYSEQSSDAESTVAVTEGCLSDREKIVTQSMEYINEATPKEAKKAVLAILRQNYFYLKDNDKPNEGSNVSVYSDKLYSELCTLYDDLNTDITFDGKKVYIPLVKSSGTNTATSDEYPYMSAVASPWDTFLDSYDRQSDIPCGVSTEGISYLCKEGYSCTEALLWYLPSFEIKAG